MPTTLSKLCTALNRHSGVIQDIQKRFELPVFKGAAKPLSALAAARKVLAAAGKPLHYQEITNRILTAGLSPHARLRQRLDVGSTTMKKNAIVIAAVAVYCAVYCGFYAAARLAHVLVMYDGCRGEHGVHVADLGPVPSSTVIICGTANFVFKPLMKIETVLRNKRSNQASEATSEPAPGVASSSR